MTERKAERKSIWFEKPQWVRRVHPAGIIGGSLAGIALVYLGYDLMHSRMAPCESIFRQTATGLSTRIRFLKAEGELQIGRDVLAELDERAQMTALNLKTCCTVLDAGRLDPEQFLQCKDKARSYEARVEDIAAIVKSAVMEASSVTGASANAATDTPSVSSDTAAIESKIKAARSVSKDFNAEVVEVRKAQELQTLEAMPLKHVDVSAKEHEPNDSNLATNRVELGQWITGSIGAGGDADFYAFTAPETHRDWIQIEVQNRSESLEPRLELFDAEKTSLASRHKTTPGADLSYRYVAMPGASFAVRVSNYYGKSVGVYLLKVTATKAFDSFEPNDDVLSARLISLGATTGASIMDGADVDYYVVETDDAAGKMTVVVSNQSTSLHPNIAVFDGNKASVGHNHNTTKGADVSYAFDAKPNARYFVRVSDYYTQGSGAYALSASME